MNRFGKQKIDWEKMQGLIPAVVQDSETLQVLMVGYMNQAALDATIEKKQVTFFSRSKNRQWTKGETSGNHFELIDIELDCDGDSLLVSARAKGPACHMGTTSCFSSAKAPGIGFLSALNRVIESRFLEAMEPGQSDNKSYTVSLFKDGLDRMAQKVGEEGVEVVIAAKNKETEPLVGEAADLIFHLLVLLQARSLSLFDVVQKLRSRHQVQETTEFSS